MIVQIIHVKHLICKYYICNIVFVFEIQYKILYFFHWSYKFYFEYANILLKLGKTVVLFLHYDCIMILNPQMCLYWVKFMHHNEREEIIDFELCEKLWELSEGWLERHSGIWVIISSYGTSLPVPGY